MMSTKSLTIVQGALVCEESRLRGEITIGAGTIVHPGATIYAEAGPIVIGNHCIIEEQAKIIYRNSIDKNQNEPPKKMIIGSNNVFEVDCTVEAAQVGDNNVFEPKSFVGNKVTITDGCVIGAGCNVTEEQVIPKNTVIFGRKHMRREALDKPATQLSQMEALRKLLPGYHRIHKATDLVSDYKV